MKKQIMLENEAVDYLRGAIMQTAGVSNKADARKMDLNFKSVAEPLKAFRDAANAIRIEFRSPKKDADGNDMKDQDGEVMYRFTKEKEPEVEAAMLALSNTKVAIQFEREAFALLASKVDGVFDRKETQESGIAGEVQMKMIALIDDAFENATDVE